MVEVYGKKARQINAQDPAHRHAYTWVTVQAVSVGKTKKYRSGGNERKEKNFQSQEGESNPQPSPYKARLQSYSKIYTAQRSLASVAI